MTTRTVLTDQIAEKSIGIITALVTDENGIAISSANLTTLTLTLYEKATKAIVNTRSAQNVLNANNVTVDTSGNLTWNMQSADNAIIGAATIESHVALFEWTWSSGTKYGKYEIEYPIKNLYSVT